MPSTSTAQQHFFGLLYAHPELAKQKGIHMTHEQIGDFARTKTTGLPEHAPKRHTATDSLRHRMHSR